jgi:CDP-paratose 2-epimerase
MYGPGGLNVKGKTFPREGCFVTRMNILVTGGCGFIGCNLVARLLAEGHAVCVLDNLSRPGSEFNLEWLRSQGTFAFERADVTDTRAIREIVRRPFDAIVHLAGQTGVSTSVTAPAEDFLANALGTLNVLEAVRERSPETAVIYSSTNKVYGDLSKLATISNPSRYDFASCPQGIDEDHPLDFNTPYGASKGAADCYVRMYAALYGLKTVTVRQSCVYGTRQIGWPMQGWVSWFAYAHLERLPIEVYGDGRQTRDLLHVDDLVDCYLLMLERLDRVAGASFNVGGGAGNTFSILELFSLLEEWQGRPVAYRLEPARAGDQRVFVSDNRKAGYALGWQPKVAARCGVQQMLAWIAANSSLWMSPTQTTSTNFPTRSG